MQFGTRYAPSFSGGNGSVTAVSPPGEGEVSVALVPRCLAAETPGHFTYRSISGLEYRSWRRTGALDDKRLGQPITLPEGSTFSGSGELNTRTGGGSLEGDLAFPPLGATLDLFGSLPTTLDLTLAQVGPAEGTISEAEAGRETPTLPVKLNLGVTSVKLLGLTIRTRCATAEPVALNLATTLTCEELQSKGWGFTGTTTLPAINCEGGFRGRLFGFVLSSLLSGPENPYSLSVRAPG